MRARVTVARVIAMRAMWHHYVGMLAPGLAFILKVKPVAPYAEERAGLRRGLVSRSLLARISIFRGVSGDVVDMPHMVIVKRLGKHDV